MSYFRREAIVTLIVMAIPVLILLVSLVIYRITH